MKYTQLLLCFILITQAGRAQISGPATGTVGVPATFSTTEGGSDYNWTFGASAQNVDPANYNPKAIRLGSLGNKPSGTSMVFDGTNWYSFSTGIANGQVMRASFGSDPTSTPTITALTTSITSSTANRTKSINVIYDSTAGRWFAMISIMDESGLTRLDFGNTGLSNLAPTATVIPTNPSTNQADGQIRVVRDNGIWHCVVSAYNSVGWSYYNLGASLATLSASTPLTRVALTNNNSCYYSLYKEGQEWFAIASNNSSLYRFEFGTSLQNVPNVVALPAHGGSLIRGICLVSGCNNQLYGFTLSSGVTVKKLDFSGSIKNAPTYTTLTSSGFTWSSDPGCTLSPFVYNDTLYSALGEFNGNGLFMLRLMAFNGSSTTYYNNATTKTFSAPGTYTVNLLVDPGKLHHQAAYCTQITISAAGLSQPGSFTAAPATVCQGQNNVTYTVPAVSGATSYEWLYTGTGATFSGTATTTTPTNNVSFSATATSGSLRVRAVNGSTTSAYRDSAITVNLMMVQPAAFTTSTAAICQGQNSVTYTVPAVNGATSYLWSFTGTGATFSGTTTTTTPTNNVSFSTTATTGNIEVKAVNSCGTSTARTTAVTINPLPAQPGSFTASSISVCKGQGNVTYTVPNTPSITYAWSYIGGTGVTINGSGNSVTADFSNTATSGTLAVTGTNSCGTSAALQLGITVNALPSAIITPAGSADICNGDSVTLTAGSGTGYNYQWKNGTSNVGTGGDKYVARTTGNYKVIVTDGNTNCKDSTLAVSVTVYNRPSGKLIPGDTSFCDGDKVTLSVVTNDTGISYRWKNGTQTIPMATSDFLEVRTTGIYTVVLALPQIIGCSDTTPALTVTVHPLPVPVINWDGQKLYTDSTYITYQWYNGSGQQISAATKASYKPTVNGSYQVEVTDSNGCSNISATYNATKVGIDEISIIAGVIKIYPNPAASFINVDAPVAVSVSVYSMEGREIIHTQEGIRHIDISNLANGMYLLQIRDTSGMLIRTEKLIKATTW